MTQKPHQSSHTTSGHVHDADACHAWVSIQKHLSDRTADRVVIGQDGKILMPGQSVIQAMGDTLSEHTRLQDICFPEDRERCAEWIKNPMVHGIIQLTLPAPGDAACRWTLLPCPDVVDGQIGVALVEKQESEVSRSLHLSERVANDGFWDWDVASDHLFVSDRWRELLGVPPTLKIERSCDWLSLIASSDLSQFQADLTLIFAREDERFKRELRIVTASGEKRWVEVRGLLIRNKAGDVVRIAGSLSQIDDRKRLEQTLSEYSANDPLTGLTSRSQFLHQVTQALRRASRLSHYSFAVLCLDVDHFKVINDSLGPGTGDRLLVKLADRLRPMLRGIDVLSRLGGDEFAILLDGLDAASSAQDVAKRIQQELTKSIELDGHTIQLTTSMGFVTSASSYTDAEEMLRDADTAMNQAKAAGKARAVEFHGAMHTEAYTRMVLEKELRKAVDDAAFTLHYQPIVSLHEQRVVGLEALIRWECPGHGWISPERFIPLAEETGLIEPIGEWVLEESCGQLNRWSRLGFERAAPIRMNVNVSRRQLENPRFADIVQHALEHNHINPADLELEVTESVIMGERDQTLAALYRLRELGVTLAMDDFGTGYSSLSCLHEYPFDVLKIDRSFTMMMNEKRQISAVIQAIVSLAHTLNIQVVAEGIEEYGQLVALQSLDCDLGQGYFFARPMSAEDTYRYISTFTGFDDLRVPA